MNKSVIIGMSGGVDSSVTAYLLKEQGYEVEGISLILFDPRSRKALGNAPCSIESVADARITAQAMGSGTAMPICEIYLPRRSSSPLSIPIQRLNT